MSYKYTIEEFFNKINDKNTSVEGIVNYFEDKGSTPVKMNCDPYKAKIDAITFFFYYITEGKLPEDIKRYWTIRALSEGSASWTWRSNTSKYITGIKSVERTVITDIFDRIINFQDPSITKTTSSKNVINTMIAFLNAQNYEYREAKNVKDLVECLKKIISGNYDSNGETAILEDVDVMDIVEGAIRRLGAKDKKQVIFTGAPGTGKTYCVETYVKKLTGEKELNGKRNRFVQFHSSYDYTDFVEGLRPVILDGQEKFVRLDGIFKEFCRKIIVKNADFIKNGGLEKDIPDYYFIIDEINRADLGKVFGELMYCFEKRGAEHKVKTQYANLPEYTIKDKKVVPAGDEFEDGFYIPENLIILCTMNDIDRSVETFDFALRRRFDWVEINADDIMESSLESILDDKYSKTVLDCANAVNMIIADKNKYGLGKEYQIGPAYFKDYDGINITLNDIWNNNIEPILKEYLRGRSICDTFVKECKAAFDKAKADNSEVSGND